MATVIAFGEREGRCTSSLLSLKEYKLFIFVAFQKVDIEDDFLICIIQTILAFYKT